MKKEELQRIMKNLQAIKAELEYEENRIKALVELQAGIRRDYRYLRRAEKVSQMIEEEYRTKTLMRLESCMEDLKKYDKYLERAEGTLEMIKDYEWYVKEDFICVVERTIEMIKEDLENGEEATVIEAIKKGYKDAKDIVSEAIPEEVKNKCGEAINTASVIGEGIANTVKQEIPQYVEKVEQLKEIPKNIGQKVKSKFRNWILSEDSEEEN